MERLFPSTLILSASLFFLGCKKDEQPKMAPVPVVTGGVPEGEPTPTENPQPSTENPSVSSASQPAASTTGGVGTVGSTNAFGLVPLQASIVAGLKNENDTWAKFKSEVLSKENATIEEGIEWLKNENRNCVLMFHSQGLLSATEAEPRVMCFTGKDQDLVFSFNGSEDRLEFMQIAKFKNGVTGFNFHLVEKNDQNKLQFKENPRKCFSCHGQFARPVWEPESFWPGAYFGGVEGDFTPPDQKYNDVFRKNKNPRYKSVYSDQGSIANFTQILVHENARRLAGLVLEFPEEIQVLWVIANACTIKEGQKLVLNASSSVQNLYEAVSKQMNDQLAERQKTLKQRLTELNKFEWSEARKKQVSSQNKNFERMILLRFILALHGLQDDERFTYLGIGFDGSLTENPNDEGKTLQTYADIFSYSPTRATYPLDPWPNFLWKIVDESLKTNKKGFYFDNFVSKISLDLENLKDQSKKLDQLEVERNKLVDERFARGLTNEKRNELDLKLSQKNKEMDTVRSIIASLTDKTQPGGKEYCKNLEEKIPEILSEYSHVAKNSLEKVKLRRLPASQRQKK